MSAHAGAAGPRRAPDWGVPPDPPPPTGAVVAAAAVAGAPGVALAAIALAASGPVAALGALAAYALAAGAWVAAQGRLALRAAGAEPLPPGAVPRLDNVAAGLAADLGVAPPRLHRAPGAGANALACWAGGPALVATDGLLERYTRTEIEAAVAHCLVRLDHGRRRRAALAAALGPAGRMIAPATGAGDDGRAAALTRYPPALAAAISKAEPRGGRFAAWWLVGDGVGPSPAARAAALEDL